MRVATWNINAAHILSESGKYDREDLGYIIDELKKINADVICLQEVETEHAKQIASTLGMELFWDDVLPNHVKRNDERLGVAVLSSLPMSSHTYEVVEVPRIEYDHPDGRTWVMWDRGFLKCEVETPDGVIVLLCGHMNPFFHFERHVMEDEFQGVRERIEEIGLGIDGPVLMVGDFNYTNIPEMLPRLFEKGFEDAIPDEPTEMKHNWKSDGILVSEEWVIGMGVIIPDKTDHALCWADITLKQ